jgi:hypothetical protein
MKTYINLWYRADFFLEWEILQTEVVEEIKIHFLFNNFFPKTVPFMR